MILLRIIIKLFVLYQDWSVFTKLCKMSHLKLTGKTKLRLEERTKQWSYINSKKRILIELLAKISEQVKVIAN